MGARFEVLFVDDEPGLADLTATFVEREDDRLSTVTATNVDAGLEKIAEHDIDCIVSDYDMPGQNGLDFLVEVRDRFGDIPFILYTGKGSEEVASEAFSMGANDYLRKEEDSDQYTLLANIIRNLAEKHLAEKEKERNLEVMETAQEGLSIINEDGMFEYVNEAYAETFGYSQTELVGQSWAFIYPEEDVERIREELLPSVPDEGVWSGETTFVRSDGSRIVTDHMLAKAQGGRLICTVRDITEERERQEELQERQTLLDLFVQTVDEYAIFTLDPDGCVTTWNSAAKRITGYEAEEIIGEQFSIFFPEADEEAGLPSQLLDQGEAEGAAYNEGWRVRKDGTRYWEDLMISAIRGDDGELVGFGNVVYDATKERAEAEQKRASEQRIKRLHDTTRALVNADTKEEVAEIAVDALDGTLGLPLGGCWLYDETTETLNPVATTEQSNDILPNVPSFKRGEGIAWEVFESGELMTFDDVSTHPKRYNSDTPFRSELILPLGSHGVLLIGSTEVGDFSESDVVVAEILTENITMALDRLERQTQLKEERAFIESALDHLMDTFYVFSPDGTPIRWNSQLNAVTGYTDEEIAEMHVVDFFEGDDKDDIVETLKEVLETGEAEATANLVTKDGERIPFKFTGALLTDSTGATTGLVGIGRDISDQQAYESELERRNKRLGELSSVLSHDLRNPLNVAQGYVEMVQETGEIDRLDYVERALRRMNTLIDDLLVLARQGRVISTMTTVTLKETAEQAWEHVETKDASLTLETDGTFQADQTRLLQLLENLVRNAIEHGGSDVTVRIGDLPSGFYVEDTGPGFPDEIRERLENGESIEGHLGFQIVQTISDAHDWKMTLTESAAGGARIEFRFGDGAEPGPDDAFSS